MAEMRRKFLSYLLRTYTGYVMKHVNRFAAIFAIAAASYAQTAPAKKSFQFHGKVTAVASDGLTVDGAKVEGWMDAMTMKYKVDDTKVLKTVKVGDEIKATVYEGDYTLHKVEVAAKPAK
jgi:Cu/Ag efflux protein CusF